MTLLFQHGQGINKIKIIIILKFLNLFIRVKRLNWNEKFIDLDEKKYLYAPGQGALGV